MYSLNLRGYLRHTLAVNSQRLENDIRRLFPEAFEPELVNFNHHPNYYWVSSGYESLGIPRHCGLYFRESDMKNPKMQKVDGGWVLTFEKK